MPSVLSVPNDFTPDILHMALQCLEADGVIALATESFYALAAGVKYPKAIERISRMKGDRQDKPILLLVGSKEQVEQVAAPVSPVAELLMDRFWPGPVTLVLPTDVDLPPLLTGHTSTIGVRQPGRPQLLQLLELTGPLTGTSANRSGMAPASSGEVILEEFGDEVDLILDSGPSPGGKPSTLLEVGGEVRLLREGPVTAEDVHHVLAPHGLHLKD